MGYLQVDLNSAIQNRNRPLRILLGIALILLYSPFRNDAHVTRIVKRSVELNLPLVQVSINYRYVQVDY